MSGDIVERLRLLAATYPLWGEVKTRSTAAADQIERLRAEVERLQRWKADAVTLLKQWNQIADDVIAQLDADDTLGLRLPDIVASELERLRVERDASRLIISDLTAEVERLRAENAERAQGWRAERALADQLADALGNEWPGISNKPYSDVSTAHAATTAALSAWEEARRER